MLQIFLLCTLKICLVLVPVCDYALFTYQTGELKVCSNMNFPFILFSYFMWLLNQVFILGGLGGGVCQIAWLWGTWP